MGSKGRVLIFGATGHIGQFLVRASVEQGYATTIFTRPSTAQTKPDVFGSFKDLGVKVIEGSLDDEELLLAAAKEVDAVISALGDAAISEQEKIVAAIKKAENIKRFLPSEFGSDVEDHAKPPETTETIYGQKVAVRRKVEEAGIPYTYVFANLFAGNTLPKLTQSGKASSRKAMTSAGYVEFLAVFSDEQDVAANTIKTKPPQKTAITTAGYLDYTTIWVDEKDVATYAVKTLFDPRTENKILYLKPPQNILTVNEVVNLWEKKIGNSLGTEHASKTNPVKQSITSPISSKISSSLQNFKVREAAVVAHELYPEVKYTSVSEYLDKLV